MTNQTDSTAPITNWLSTLNGHLVKHRLADTVITVDMPHGDYPGKVQLYPWRGTDLGLLAEWAPTLRGITITVTATPDEPLCAHLSAMGLMGGGHPVHVVVIVEGAEFDLLAVNTPLLVGAEIPVPLLLSLVDAQAAESQAPVAAGSAVAS